jgi:hypothetical protein
VNILNSGSSVGTPSTSINDLHAGLGCSYIGRAANSPCKNGAATGGDNVWATTRDSTVPSITAPVADFTNWYTNASPGPKNPCSTVSGTPPKFESTSNTARDNSVTPTFDLTKPGAAYTCKTANGEISWDGVASPNGILKVSGTIYIDGSATSTSAIAQYNGQATLYLTGTFTMSGTKLCGGLNGAKTDCDFTTWNPNTELFAIVTDGGTPPTSPSGIGTTLTDTSYQGALYSTGKIRLAGTTSTDGPMVASEVELGYNAHQNGAAKAYGFPVITSVPAGLPGMPPNVHALPQAPKYTSG